MMEKEDELVKLLKNKQDGIKVTIGNENKVDAIKNFSLITASYELSENQMGTIALLGPTRMEYRKVINILSALSKDRKSTRLNSSHVAISYAVFCLKKKNTIYTHIEHITIH